MLPEVFIIESLRKEDHAARRLEGNLIAQLLKMGGRHPLYNLVERYDQFIDAITQFGESQYRYLHLSSAISLKFTGEFEIIGVNWGHEHPDDPRTS